MPRLLVRWLITTLAILTVPHLIHGVTVESFGTALAAAAILGVLNVLVRPVLILLTLPLSVLTLGLFLLVINAIVFQWAGALVQGFHVDSFGSAFLAALLVSFISWLINASTGWQNRSRIQVHVSRSGPVNVNRGAPIDVTPKDTPRIDS